jgi:quercetin dioxygenase-like cupin family protein
MFITMRVHELRHILRAGDAVYAPPGEEHWHGAAPESFLLHTAISLGHTRWFGEVTAEQYRAACDEAAEAP